MAPEITPSEINAPYTTVPGISSRMAAINSITPEPILPHGSRPRVEKMYTDSFAAENLKNRVCARITAAGDPVSRIGEGGRYTRYLVRAAQKAADTVSRFGQRYRANSVRRTNDRCR